MPKITLTESDGPYHCLLDTGAMTVQIREAFNGVRFITEDGEQLAICMRDSGFELRYSGNNFETGWIEFKEGIIKYLSGLEITKNENT